MIISKKEKDRSGLIGRDLVCSVAVPSGATINDQKTSVS
ncbi:hypothetical protein ADIARSV_0177 [Arcticibacter svalbardensis MN12-7]|uniref:Uncharacterized protein n=1 Tax=Arcticibacter svalbardensis MN12-7 TaxID=1150600 RepID=R9GYS6_9SPHI|nr:hypothetical protein ADIARSV_0177 [Arcticibacter svalbardensis MN12-7]